MWDISMWTWVQATFVLLVCAFMGGAIGWGFGADHATKRWTKRLATREEAFKRAFGRVSGGVLYWYWWVGLTHGLEHPTEYLVAVVAQDEEEAKNKLSPATLIDLKAARNSGRKDLATHVLHANSKEVINVQRV